MFVRYDGADTTYANTHLLILTCYDQSRCTVTLEYTVHACFAVTSICRVYRVDVTVIPMHDVLSVAAMHIDHGLRAGKTDGVREHPHSVLVHVC